jgi:hypothetical protein
LAHSRHTSIRGVIEEDNGWMDEWRRERRGEKLEMRT